ncbi:hypothetical protein N665_1798s0003 [Sinapis alba]|nr:hypothetical protein N665_1798s0003 [Sinapis alba]
MLPAPAGDKWLWLHMVCVLISENFTSMRKLNLYYMIAKRCSKRSLGNYNEYGHWQSQFKLLTSICKMYSE